MKLFRSSLGQSSLLTGGTVANSLLGLLFYLLVARNLGLAEFGRFSFLLGIGMLAAEVGDWGFGSAIVKFGSEVHELPKIISVNFIQRLVVFGVFFMAASVASFILKENYLLALLVAASLSFLAIITQSFLACQKYVFYVLTNILGNLSRLLLTVIFLSTADSALVIFAGANIFALVAGITILALVVPGRLFDWSDLKGTFKKVFPYSKWLGGSFALASLAGKIDIPAVYFLAGGQAAGIYSSAQKLVSVLPQVGAAIEGVFAPKLSRQEDFQPIFKNYLTIILLGIAGLLLVIPLSGSILTFLWGSKYAAATGVFQLLLLGMVFFFLSGPFIAVILYRFGKSNVHFVGNAIQLAVSLGLYFFLVPKLGAVGAALSFIAAQVTIFLLFAGVFLKLDKNA